MSTSIELQDVKLDSETETETESSTKLPSAESHDQEEATPTEGAKPKHKAYNLTLVDAAQYGNLNRCRELVEKEGADVTVGDDENITPLHWAAINNRIPVVSYFLQKGANINLVGGELRSPPLHWATRQGHLSMVVHLMRYGAQPEVLDGEGLNCLHIAAQFGLTGITGYLICCRTPMHIDCLDTLGRTPLMHAAARANRSSDTTRLLVALGANIRATDKNKDTPLHHAAANLNYGATKVLIDAGAPIEVKNNDGKTPYDLAMENQNVYDMDQLLMARQKRSPQGVLEYFTRDPTFCWWLMMFFSILVLGVIGWLGVFCPNWWSYFIASTLLGAVVRKFLIVYLRVLPDNNPMAFGIVLGTKLWLYITAMGYFYPAGTLTHYIWMHVALFVTMGVFYRLTKSDPGLIPRCKSLQEAHRTFTELCERGQYSESAFCTTCLVRRPLRSKHCAACNQCVARFDHHCPWINNCVGLRNHKIFLAYLICLLFMLTWGAKASIIYLYQLYPATHGNFIVRGYHYVTVNPWVGYIMISCFIHMTWVYILLLAQLFQMICQGVTTNEMRNRYRYGHFTMFDGVNPFHRGVLTNCIEFFGFTCCQDSESQVDWTRTYNLPKNYNKDIKAQEDPLRKAKIPLPFSATWDPTNDKIGSKNQTRKGRGQSSSRMGLETGYGSSEDDACQRQFTANQEYTI